VRRDVGSLLAHGAARPMISLLPILLIGVSSPQVSAVSGTPLVDGDLNDAVWQKAPPLDHFRQSVPDNGAKPSVSTRVAFAYDQEALYIAVWANDPLPPRVVSFERDRLKYDDKIRVLIDTYDDDRNAYLFATNPAGVLWDSQIGGNGRQKNKDWDGLWWVETVIHDGGWTAEFRIPFASLRLPERSQQTWGLNVERFSASRRETVRWKAWERGARFEQVARAGTLRGLQGPPRQLGLVLKPYGLVGSGASRIFFQGGLDADLQISRPVTLSLTLFPDFAQAEADRAQVNLGLSAIYLDEKRRFFLEGKDFFAFSMGDQIRPFYSRRIGLNAEGDTVSIQGGARLLGKWGSDTLGLLLARMGPSGDEGGIEAGALRYSRDVFSSSSLGTLMTVRRQGQDLNSVLGLDFRYSTNRFQGAKNLVAEAMVLSSLDRSDSVQTTGFAHRFLVSSPNDLRRWKFVAERSGASFEPGLGFLSRSAFHRFAFDWTKRWRPETGKNPLYVEMTPVDVSLRLSDPDFNFQALHGEISPFSAVSRKGLWMKLELQGQMERLQEPWDLLDSLQVPAGDHLNSRFALMTDTPNSAPFGFFGYLGSGPYFGTWRTTLIGDFRAQVSRRLRLFYRHRLDSFDWNERVALVHVSESTAKLALSRKLYGSLKVQYVNTEDLWRLSARLRYTPRSGLDGYLVYDHRLEGEAGMEFAVLGKVVWQYAR